ncbi:hypothetical protein [Sphingomonas sp.]|uniref:glycine-rich domain-containing protein n=1 Tax=Sphingomonas sp. TaxID=28214 RepID=UPI0035AF27D4
MDDEARALLSAIETLAFDPSDASLRFTDRLAREQGWSRRRAQAVTHEYRRFLYLAATTDQPMTPSDAVDQAWHLHLTYTRSYWDDLCGRTLRRPLHHGPTPGGERARAYYHDRYAATLLRYASVFGHPPPPAIWPDAGRRFSVRGVRVDRSRMVVVPKRALALATLPPVAMLTTAAVPLAGLMPVALTILIAALAIAGARKQQQSKQRRGDTDVDFDFSDSDGGDGGDSGCAGCGGD